MFVRELLKHNLHRGDPTRGDPTRQHIEKKPRTYVILYVI